MVDSNAAPPAASTAISSKLKPVDVNANDLASMADTVYTASEPLSDSSSDSSISDDPSEDSTEDSLEHHMFHYSGATPAAPLDDMDTALPEEDPDSVADDANMPDSSTLPLSSVGDQQQTLGTAPPMPPYGTLNPGFCFGRPRQVGIKHSSQYHKTHHPQYQCLHQPPVCRMHQLMDFSGIRVHLNLACK